MSACQAVLEEWLQELVDQQLLSSAEAWQMQDERLMAAEGEWHSLPVSLHPLASRIWLHETLEGPPTQ